MISRAAAMEIEKKNIFLKNQYYSSLTFLIIVVILLSEKKLVTLELNEALFNQFAHQHQRWVSLKKKSLKNPLLAVDVVQTPC